MSVIGQVIRMNNSEKFGEQKYKQRQRDQPKLVFPEIFKKLEKVEDNAGRDKYTCEKAIVTHLKGIKRSFNYFKICWVCGNRKCLKTAEFKST